MFTYNNKSSPVEKVEYDIQKVQYGEIFARKHFHLIVYKVIN